MQLNRLKCFQPHGIIVIVAAIRLEGSHRISEWVCFGFFYLQESNLNANFIPE